MPQPGDFVIMLNGVGRPRFICRTTEVTIKPLSEVEDGPDEIRPPRSSTENRVSLEKLPPAWLPRSGKWLVG
jgi:hypothetical protein